MSTPEHPGLAGNFIAGLVRSGQSATAALDSYRAAGGSIRTQSWYALWHETVAAIDRAGGIAESPLGRRPGGDQISAGTWRTADRYTYMVDVLVRERGTSTVYATPFAVTSNRLVSMGGALGDAIDAASVDLDTYGEEVLGGVVTGVYDRDFE